MKQSTLNHWLLLAMVFFIAGCQKSLHTVCNPVNLSYRFCLDEPSRREAADPTLILFNGEYYLFISKSGGYFHSTDLIHWTLITTNDLPVEDYAPTVVNIDGELYFMASNATHSIYKSSDPKSGKWEIATDHFPYNEGDPMLFYDNGKVYFYSGLHPIDPPTVIEVDRNTLMPNTPKIPLFYNGKKKNGWEVPGDYNTMDQYDPWIEGTWVNKYNGKYYLQYASPGTQFKSYNDAVYISDNPLGPFTLAKHNPVAYKPEGFAAGAGHGSTFQDKYGNYWHMGTVTISVRHMFERRISLFPTFFDKDGEMYAYTGFGDYPMIIPGKKFSSPEELFPGWMLLSYNKVVETSSTLNGHPAQNAVNEDIRSWWSAETGNKGEYFSVDMGEICDVHAIQLNFGDQDANIFGRADGIYYQYYIEESQDGKNWKMLVDKSDNTIDAPHDYMQLKKAVKTRFIRVTNVRCFSGKFSISGLRVFGKAATEAPEEAEITDLTRDPDDRRVVALSWNMVAGATGYNIRYGTQRDKLYHNYIVYGNHGVTIRSLHTDQPYFFAIDSFNEGGITRGETVKETP